MNKSKHISYHFSKLKIKTSRKSIKLFLARLKANTNWLNEQRDIYPVIVFALIPTMFFWTRHNIQELTFDLMRRSLFLASLLGVGYYIIWYAIYKRDKFKASLMAIITIAITFSFGQFFKLYQIITDKSLEVIFRVHVKVVSYIFFTIIMAILFSVVAYLIKNRLKYSATIRNYLAILASILLILNLYPLFRYWVSSSGLRDTPFGQEVKVANSVKMKPDIYYIVPEDYGSFKSIKQIYNYDDTPFLKYLRQRDFYVPLNSFANYPFTTPSLVSSLNMDYIPEVFINKPDIGGYYNLEKEKIEDNRVAQFIKSQDYEFINIGPWWTATKYNKNADQDLYFPTGLEIFNRTVDLKENELILFKDTIAWPFFSHGLNAVNNKVFGLTFPDSKESDRAIQRESFLHQIEMLKKITKQRGPKYVFTQFMLPHPPYVYDKNCNPTKDMKTTNEHALFLEQMQCVNKKLKELIDYIQQNNPTKPIIILQTDEGTYPTAFRENKELDWTKQPSELLHQKADILNAYYFPDKNYSKLYQDISPVNSFRVVFNQYLGTDLKLLDDRSYFQESEKRRFFLNDLTDKLKQ
jgi:hypothetical protein